MAEQLLESGKIQEEILKQMNILKVRKEIGCLLLINSGMQTIFCVGPVIEALYNLSMPTGYADVMMYS